MMQWSNAADMFVNYGMADRLCAFLKEEALPRKRTSGGTDRQALALDNLANAVRAMDGVFRCTRLKEIERGVIFEEVRKACADTRIVGFQALDPVLVQIEKKAAAFLTDDSVRNGIAAARWCGEHGLIQQGVTIVQEVIISVVLANEQHAPTGCSEYDVRRAVADAFHVFNDKRKSLDRCASPELAQRFVYSPHISRFARSFDRLRLLRNDVNHAGMNEQPKKSADIESEYKRILCDLEEVM
jgi:hypothetical protein